MLQQTRIFLFTQKVVTQKAQNILFPTSCLVCVCVWWLTQSSVGVKLLVRGGLPQVHDSTVTEPSCSREETESGLCGFRPTPHLSSEPRTSSPTAGTEICILPREQPKWGGAAHLFGRETRQVSSENLRKTGQDPDLCQKNYNQHYGTEHRTRPPQQRSQRVPDDLLTIRFQLITL